MISSHLIRSAVVAASVFASLPAFAAEASPVCMSAGNQYQVGDYACIPACHGRQRFARCDSVADSATWTYISDVCPSALLTPKTPPASFAPVTTAMSPVPYDIPLSAIAPDFVERIAEAREPARNGKDVVTALASR